jgi:hypothetical protein
MRLLYVPLSDDALKLLRQTAEEARRRPQDQAAVLLENALGLRDQPDHANAAFTARPVDPRPAA